MNTAHFGRIVRERRERFNLSLRSLSDLVNLTTQAIEAIELGDSDPRLSSVLKIAGALQIDMGMLNSCIPTLIEK